MRCEEASWCGLWCHPHSPTRFLGRLRRQRHEVLVLQKAVWGAKLKARGLSQSRPIHQQFQEALLSKCVQTLILSHQFLIVMLFQPTSNSQVAFELAPLQFLWTQQPVSVRLSLTSSNPFSSGFPLPQNKSQSSCCDLWASWLPPHLTLLQPWGLLAGLLLGELQPQSLHLKCSSAKEGSPSFFSQVFTQCHLFNMVLFPNHSA